MWLVGLIRINQLLQLVGFAPGEYNCLTRAHENRLTVVHYWNDLLVNLAKAR